METALLNAAPCVHPALHHRLAFPHASYLVVCHPSSGSEPAERLMPFGTVAKGIFVDANGLAAYYTSMGTPHWADEDLE